jgi:hypothetical protein
MLKKGTPVTVGTPTSEGTPTSVVVNRGDTNNVETPGSEQMSTTA